MLSGQTIEGGRLQRRLLNCSRLEFQHVYDYHSRIRHIYSLVIFHGNGCDWLVTEMASAVCL